MSSARQNRHIARLIVGAMSIDGYLSKNEQKKVAAALEKLHMSELIADVGAAIEDDQGDFNMFDECRELLESLGSDASELASPIFRLITSVVASDRFVSSQEASYLSALARRLKLESKDSKAIFKQVMIECRGRLEVSSEQVDEFIHPHLKELLSFEGAKDLVGELDEDSLEEMLYEAQEALASGCDYDADDVAKSLAVLGLDGSASLQDAENVWRETIDTLNLPKMAGMGETFVTAAINRITTINDAYKKILYVHEHLDQQKKASTDAKRLEKQIERNAEPSTRDAIAGDLEDKVTGVGVTSSPSYEDAVPKE